MSDANGRADAAARPASIIPAIIIFGAAVRPGGVPSNTLRLRAEAAARFGARLAIPPLYVATGGVGRYPPSEARVMAGLLAARGVPAEQIVLEETANNSLSSVRACARLLRARDHHGPVFAATSAYHLPRCLLLLRLCGLPARPCPPPPVPASRSRWKRWFWRLREVPAVPFDAALLVVGLLLERVRERRSALGHARSRNGKR